MTRAEKVIEAQRLRATGLEIREIAEQMAANRGTVSIWLSDPDLSKQRARRATYAGRCADCGVPTDGSNGPKKAAKRCQACSRAYQHQNRYWTRERMLDALAAWVAEHGQVPSAADWTNGNIERGYPPVKSIQGEWGRWTLFLRAAGVERRSPGRSRSGTPTNG